MLKRLDNLTENVLNIIVYVASPSLEYFIKNTLKERFAVHKDFVVACDTAKQIQNAKLDSYVAPFLCNKWLININADKLNKKELLAAFSNNTSYGITVYWTSKYMIFKQMQDMDVVKKQGVYSPAFSFSRLDYGDIKHLHDKMVGTKRAMDNELLDYVCKTYKYDVQAVCDLFSLVRSGNEVTTKREIIEAVGAGGNSVGSLTLRIVNLGSTANAHPMAGKAKPKPPKKNADGSERAPRKKMTPAEREIKFRKNALAATLKLLDDLSVTFNYQTIRKFMLNTVEAFIDMKQLQIMGIYGKINKEIPENFDGKRLSMNRRFEYIVLNEISLPKLLNLKICLMTYNSFNAEVALIQAISEFYNSIRLKQKA